MKLNSNDSRHFKVPTGCGTLHVFVDVDGTAVLVPSEASFKIGKGGNCAAAYAEINGRLITLCLKRGVAVEAIVEQLSGIQCPQQTCTFVDGEKIDVRSCPDAVAKVLDQFTDEKERTDA